MANPFGSADEALSKNTGHTNASHLVRALVPRSTSKWVEVISNTAITGLTNGVYDTDGYFRGDNSTRRGVNYSLPANVSPATGWTMIISVKYNSAGASYGGDTFSGLIDSLGSGTQFRVRLYSYDRRYYPWIIDSVANSAGINSATATPTVDAYTVVVQGTNGSQKGYARAGSTNYPTTPSTSSTALGGTASCNSFAITYDSLWNTQYAFLYDDATMSETDINAIIANPAAVLNVGSVGKNLVQVGAMPIVGATLVTASSLAGVSQSWRVLTTAANGTSVHVTVFSGASPTYAILAQGVATVAGGYASIAATTGVAGDKAFAFVHNYNDNTASASIYGGPGIATRFTG